MKKKAATSRLSFILLLSFSLCQTLSPECFNLTKDAIETCTAMILAHCRLIPTAAQERYFVRACGVARPAAGRRNSICAES
jgi:hypothetical protein